MHTFSLIDTVLAAGVITDATPIAEILSNVLQFLLSIVGILGIIGLVVSGALYFFATGDNRQIAVAKRAALASVIGIVIALGAYILITQIASFFS
ncbi:MAG: hypothetical protein A2878_03355 [Candidatus Moranbacteria bacterium RIFCSPHIGHO2_01_FULL_54_31]|nr:MAG: hypothetical protein A2878_03355 [Candidatus Moranbacteria bacterium RIFCSPHIGHO2_01_FULL_54_31]